jgi:hypothetical protein
LVRHQRSASTNGLSGWSELARDEVSTFNIDID